MLRHNLRLMLVLLGDHMDNIHGHVPQQQAHIQEEAIRVLVVDNEEDIRCLLADVLSGAGHSVTGACDGSEALEIFKREDFDLVLTDMGMPVMSGWEVARSVKKIAPGVMVAMITGWGTDFDDVQLHESGVDIIVSKPFRMDQILQLAREALVTRKNLRAARGITR